jgi:hypothetical protein
MKTKKVGIRKLNLKRTTVTRLDNLELNKVNGGYSEYPCETFQFTICRTGCISDCPVCETERGITCA